MGGRYHRHVDEHRYHLLRGAAAGVLPVEPVAFAYLFGSAARGQGRPGSDLDVAIFLDAGVPSDLYLDASLRIAGRLGDATKLGGVDVLVMNDAPLPLLGRIIRDRRVLYTRDEPARVEFESRKLREFFDFQIHAEPLDRALLRAIAEGRR